MLQHSVKYVTAVLAIALLTDCGLNWGKQTKVHASTLDLLTQPGNQIELSIPLPQPPVQPPSKAKPGTPIDPDTLPDSNADSELVRLEIQLSRRRVVLYRGEAVVKHYPIAVGRPGWETPKGDFKVRHKIKNPIWTNPLKKGIVIPGGDPDNPLGRYWIGFWTDGKNWIGFHGTPTPRSVGRAASHGCIRMYNKDIEELFKQVDVGTPVSVVK